MDSAEIALAVHWTLLIAVGVAVIVGNLLWVRWLILRFAFGDRSPLVLEKTDQRPFWSPSDFLVYFGSFLTAFFLFSAALRQPDSSSDASGLASPETEVVQVDTNMEILQKAAAFRKTILINMIASLIAVAVTIAWLVLSYARPPRDFGLTLRWADVRYALIASLWVLAPVLVISSLASKLIEYRHILLDTMAADPSWGTISLMFLSAVVVTPVAEELGFRMLLQGGTEGLLVSWAKTKPEGAVADGWITWLPIVVAGGIFALMHSGQGAAPIPLFFLSLGLGYLYHRTGRLSIPIIIHTVLNALTLCVEYSRVCSEL